MSGGVDSSVAAALLADGGYDVFGIMLRLWSEPVAAGSTKSNRCCTPDQMADARRVADLLDIPFYVLDTQEFFREKVVDYFIDEHLDGRTPNPCIQCNRYVRFEFLLDHALALGADFLATGHYARIDKNDGRFRLLRAVDTSKDQSYALYVLDQKRLAKTFFPIGDYTKMDVRKLADSYGLPVVSKEESMDLCFLSDGDPKRFLMDQPAFSAMQGPILSAEGNLLGQHDGLPYYTIGQRKGLGIAVGQPLYVLSKDAPENALIVGSREQLGQNYLTADQTNWVSGSPPKHGAHLGVKIRYSAIPSDATVVETSQDHIEIEFTEPVFGITSGQSAVFYDDDVCLGGGIITEKDNK
jgi:tRNA-specific 2-thiouridylase